ncbi:MAG: GtrA family protein [Bacteroidota bacterium]
MATFIKAQAASLTATLVDFGVTFLLKMFFQWTMPASILGTVSGGIVNFTMNRVWVFEARDSKIHFHAIKYVLVWIGNLLLVTGGVFVLTRYAGWEVVKAKIIVSVFVGVFYNYVLQKKFVFK